MEFKDNEKRYWNSFYSTDIGNYSINRDLSYHNNFKNLLKQLPAGSKILELGCGVRCDGLEIAISGKTVYETDISQVAVDNAKKIYQNLGLEKQGIFLTCDAENLPFANNFFHNLKNFIIYFFIDWLTSNNAPMPIKPINQRNFN